MVYETTTTETRHGYQGLCRRFGSDAEWFEYSDGHFLVMVGEKLSLKGEPALNIRIHHNTEFKDDGMSLKSPVECGFTFATLWDAYTEACNLWGFHARADKARFEAFFDRTRGYGVLWA